MPSHSPPANIGEKVTICIGNNLPPLSLSLSLSYFPHFLLRNHYWVSITFPICQRSYQKIEAKGTRKHSRTSLANNSSWSWNPSIRIDNFNEVETCWSNLQLPKILIYLKRHNHFIVRSQIYSGVVKQFHCTSISMWFDP